MISAIAFGFSNDLKIHGTHHSLFSVQIENQMGTWIVNLITNSLIFFFSSKTGLMEL